MAHRKFLPQLPRPLALPSIPLGARSAMAVRLAGRADCRTGTAGCFGGSAMGLTPLPDAPPPEPGPNQVANRNHTTRRYHNTERQLVVDGFTTSLLLVLAAAYLPHVMQGARATRPELQTVLGMDATFLGARSPR